MSGASARIARCRCGQLTAICVGEPVRVSVCHCRDCQRRTGSPFSAQARWPDAAVTIGGDARTYEHVAESGRRGWFRSCPVCASTIAYALEAVPGVVAIPLGAFAGDDVPPPAFSVWESRKQPWVEIVVSLKPYRWVNPWVDPRTSPG